MRLLSLFFPKKIYVYGRTPDSEGKLPHNSTKDIAFASANSKPAGIWSDGTTMWVADGNTINQKGKIFAYNLSDGSRVSEIVDGETTYPKDISIDLSFLGDGHELADIWSNGTTTNSTMWVLVNNEAKNDGTYKTFVRHLTEDRELYAYKWGFGEAEREEDLRKDIPLRKGVSSSHYLKGAQAIFSHGGIMYVSNWEAKSKVEDGDYNDQHDKPADLKIYAYGLPTSLPEFPSGQSVPIGNPGNIILRSLSLSGISLSPAFSPDTLYYTASVEFDVASTTVTATPNDSESSISILWNDLGATRETAGNSAQVSLQEGDNLITVFVTASNGFSRLRYFVVVNKLAAPPVSGGPLPLSFQPSSSATTAGKSRLMAAASLPNGGIRFVFLAPNAEVEVESSLDLTARSWSPLPNSQFQIRRERTFDGQSILTLILPKADEKQRFLRLIPRR